MSHAVLKQAKTDLGYAENQLENHRKELVKAEEELRLAHARITHWEAAVDRSVRMLKVVEATIESEETK